MPMEHLPHLCEQFAWGWEAGEVTPAEATQPAGPCARSTQALPSCPRYHPRLGGGAVIVVLSIAFPGPGGETGEGTRLAPRRLQTVVVVLHGPCQGLGTAPHDQHVEDVTCV